MNYIRIDLERTLGNVSRNIFGGFAEHLYRCIYGGIYEPGSPLADKYGFRTDVIAAIRSLQMPIIRYPGGNFVSSYRWRDGVGPLKERPARTDMAWRVMEPNHFGTNEFVRFCRELNAEPYLTVNCGDGDMREACDWVEYCNGTWDTALVQLRRRHGFEEPHKVKYWSIGNEVDGSWQIGYKTPQEYARAFTEFGKAMRRIDPDIKLVAATISLWTGDIVERTQLLLEQASELIDYLSLHWYVGNKKNDFAAYMTLSELFEERLSACEGLIRAMRLSRGVRRHIAIAVDEWNIWYRTFPRDISPTLVRIPNDGEEVYNLEDALVIAMNLNAFIRHAYSVGMANLSEIVNVFAPILTRPDGLVRQTIFYPFELYSRTCGQAALDVFWQGDTFAGGKYTGIRMLDVAATLNEQQKQLVLYVVNRSQTEPMETMVSLYSGRFRGNVRAFVVNGPDIKAENTFETPNTVGTRESVINAEGESLNYTFEPHSVTALVCSVS